MPLSAPRTLLLPAEPTDHLHLGLPEACGDALARIPGAAVLARHDRRLGRHRAETAWRVVE
jgi:ATPase subunit of ABC transporter with duplicated ATPase domains